MRGRRLEPFGEQLRRLRDERGLTRSELSAATARLSRSGHFVREITIKDNETKQRFPTIDIIELLAAAMDLPPETFHEYRLRMAIRELDPREVGLDQAMATLERIEPFLPPR